VRGYRIELGEVEAALTGQAGVKEAVVIVSEDERGEKQLVAYVVASDEQLARSNELGERLRAKLPAYMLPSAFILLDKLPLTPNGKVDRKALPAPMRGRAEASSSYIAPRTATEELLASIWGEVLRVERVGVRGNFFELGGHSLLATQLVSRVRGAFHVELPLRSLFESPTIVEQSRLVGQLMRDGEGLEAAPIVAAQREQPLPLSFAQQRLWFLDQLEPGSALYNIPLALRLRGALDRTALSTALNEVIRRHEVLRTSFVITDDQPVQVITATMHLTLPVTDLSDLSESEREAEVKRIAADEAAQPFDLSAGPLLHARLLRLNVEEHVVLLTMHHIISDGWSMGVLVREVSALYAAFSSGQPSPLPELQIQYADYALWQREQLQCEVLERQLSYWREQMQGAPQVLELPTDRPRPSVQNYRGSSISFLLDHELAEQLRQLSREQNVTLFMTLLASFQTLLSRYSGQNDVLVGTPIANRTHRETEDLIGFFVNTLVLRNRFTSELNFRELLEQTREVTLGAYAHQELPFERLVEELQPERSLSHTPLFQVMFTLQNTPREQPNLTGLEMEVLDGGSETAKFELSLSVTEVEEGLAGAINYRTELFEAATIERMIAHYERLLRAIVVKPGQSVSSIELLSAAEREQMLVGWNETTAGYPQEKCIHELFEEQVERTPDALAIVFGEQQLSYRELNQRANQLAHYLRQLGVAPEDRVGILMPRSIEMVVSVLAVLKAGGAYVPLDPEYPQERLCFMIRDASASVLLTHSQLTEHLPQSDAVLIAVERCEELSRQSTENLARTSKPSNLAYVIYTSGSTGTPKGVMIEQQSLVNYLCWATSAYRLSEAQGAPLHSSLSFDLSVTSLFTPLLAGRPVHLLAEGLEALEQTLESGPQYSLVKLTPAHLEVLGRSLSDENAPGQTRALIVGGESLSGESLTYWREHSPQTVVVNEYGPTETVVGCCVYARRAAEINHGAVPIGRPIANTELYILDERMEPVAVGVRGELYIGGRGVGRGYLNRPELTAERFLPHPFSAEPGARLYRTGDIARYLEDGNIEFIGRIDEQVKVRGYRIELGEIEAVLAQHSAIREAVTAVREGIEEEKHLAAYVVAANGQQLTSSELRSYLQERLPAYMVPSAFVQLDELPLTLNGKVDRRALPAPEQSRVGSEVSYVAPKTATEELLTLIWGEVLRVERVGVDDNFFELGGHSLLVVKVRGRLREVLQREISIADMFRYPTIKSLARHLDHGQSEDTSLHGTQDRARKQREAINRQRRQLKGRKSRG
jgi:amino acid adenylation domain-containing protein